MTERDAAPPNGFSQNLVPGRRRGSPRDTTIPASAWLTDEAEASAKSEARRRKDAAVERRQAARSPITSVVADPPPLTP